MTLLDIEVVIELACFREKIVFNTASTLRLDALKIHINFASANCESICETLMLDLLTNKVHSMKSIFPLKQRSSETTILELDFDH